MQQRTDEWLAARAGKVTASCLDDVMASKTTAAYQNYMAKLICERLTGQFIPSDTNAAMRRGTELEPLARDFYVVETGAMVEEVGFFEHSTITNSGASPDGIIGTDGLIEIKCPNTATHIKTLESKKPSLKYMRQMQWQMACTGRLWCDFVSFDDRLPEHLSFFCTRIERDDEMIAELEKSVIAFLNELEAKINKLPKAA